jgi:hypothetical protein
MKKHNTCIIISDIVPVIILAFCLFGGSCISSRSGTAGSPAGFTPLVVESVIPFDEEDPESARLEINLALSEPADSGAGIGGLVRELLYEGQSAENYGKAVAAIHGELYDALRAEWIPRREDVRTDSFNWYYSEKVENRTVSVKGLIPGRENLLVLTKTTESYLGGAHGDSVTSCFVIDPAAAKRLTLDDIFNSREELRLKLEAELRRQYQLPEDAPLSAAGFFEDKIKLPENFFPVDDASGDVSGGDGDGSPVMRFLWNAYEIAPYVMGAIEISLPIGDLAPLFRK